MSTRTDVAPADLRQERWRQEAAFFDQAARQMAESALAIDPLAFERYTRPILRRRFSMEYRFRILRPLEGKAVLDVGCGDGLNAVILARLGARVTGVDVSRGALDVARRRAERSGVGQRVSLICGPIEQAHLADKSFDVVWGDGILHHVLDDLDLVLSHLARCTRPEGLLLFSEPINLSPMLRRLRGLVPVRTDATPGERPMLRSELELVRSYVPDLRIRHFGLLGRLDRFILVNHNYERSPLIRRGLVSAIDALDWALLSLPLLKSLAGTCVMYGHPVPSAEPAEAAA